MATLFEEIYTTQNTQPPIVYMERAYVLGYEPGNVCGTTACHGGWAAVLFLQEELNAGLQVNYNEGADVLAQELGFWSSTALVEWAGNNPELWGNSAGECMFYAYPIAFTPEEEWPEVADVSPEEGLSEYLCEAQGADWEPITLGTIVEHYRAVAQRLRALA